MREKKIDAGQATEAIQAGFQAIMRASIAKDVVRSMLLHDGVYEVRVGNDGLDVRVSPRQLATPPCSPRSDRVCLIAAGLTLAAIVAMLVWFFSLKAPVPETRCPSHPAVIQNPYCNP